MKGVREKVREEELCGGVVDVGKRRGVEKVKEVEEERGKEVWRKEEMRGKRKGVEEK